MLSADGNHVPAGVRPRKAHRGGSGIGAIDAELDHLGAGNQVDHTLGRFAFEAVRPDEIDSLSQLALRGADNRLESVAEGRGAQPAAELHELIAVDVPDPASGSAVYHRRHASRILVVALSVGMRAAGDEALDSRRMLVRRGELGHLHSSAGAGHNGYMAR